MTPQFWIVAGPNGSGKSTVIREGLLTRWTGVPLPALSPDDVMLALRPSHPRAPELELLRMAQQQSDAMVRDAIASRQTVMVETVLSSGKFRPFVEAALAAGMEFGFAYVIVGSSELNIWRVADRVIEGGHDVPEDRILARRQRSIAEMPWFAARATVGIVVENTEVPVLLAEKRRDEAGWRLYDPARLGHLGLHLDPRAPPSA